MIATDDRLFRRSARAGGIHPLQRLIGLYRRGAPETGWDVSTHGLLHDLPPETRHDGPAARPVDPPPPGAGWRIDADNLTRRVSQLPALPQAVLQALALLRSDTASDTDCAARIALDPAITARILRLANSAFYGVSGRVATIRDAVLLLGRRSIGAMLAAAAVADSLARSPLAGHPEVAATMGHFWRHALASALAAQALARGRPPDQDVAFTAALLHDIGRLVLCGYHADGLAAVRAAAAVDDADTLPFERALLGLDHAEVGAMVARHWRFPPEVVAAIAAHHGPPAGDGPVTLADLVHLADAIAHVLDLEDDPAESVPALAPSSWRRIALDDDEAQRVFGDVEAGVRALSKSLLG
ncbi:HDOD domain-containing protein [Leptothrix discophora]|uniref:HDOD domain-containing protein n=1 Tax=Leptothrix discophora TaxID=89 RepID=A0ABT9G7E3_LEPDI|nr:HDOD domain-containing protein [Leptothrix discophora]MDP4302404.1 HDOD domain-containing protein [Leptothrix discophora]